MLAALVVVALAGCDHETRTPLRVGINPWFGYAPMHLAAADGLLEAPSVRIVDYASGTQVMRAFQNGNIEAAATTLDEALMLAATVPSTRLVLVLDHSVGGDGIVARGDGRELGDMRGSRVGVENTATGAYVLDRALDHAGVDRGSVDIVPLSREQHEAAFFGGRVEFLVTYEPALSTFAARGGEIVFSTRQIPGEVLDVLVVRGETLRCCRDQLRHLATGWSEAVGRVRANADAATQRLTRLASVEPAVARRALAHVRFYDLDESRALLRDTSSVIYEAASLVNVTLFEKGFIDHPLEAGRLIDARALAARGR